MSSKGFDKFGNYTFGIKEHIIFPEVNFDRIDKIRGLDIVIVISSKNKEHSFALLEKLNFPFIKKRRKLKMAKASAINKNNRRIKLSNRYFKKEKL